MTDNLVIFINVGESGANAMAYQSAYDVGPIQVVQLQVITMRVVMLVVEHIFQHFLGTGCNHRTNHNLRVCSHWAEHNAHSEGFEAPTVLVVYTLDNGAMAQIDFCEAVGNIERQAV